MSGSRRWRWVVLGLPVLLFGLGCLNYTEHFGWEHHTGRAAELGVPPPSAPIQRMGMLLTAVGGIVTGFGFARHPA